MALSANAKDSANAALVKFVDGQSVTSSLMVSQTFDKRHDNVMRDIKHLISQLKRHLPNFEEMFKKVELPDNYGRMQPAYLITRDGFSLLAMGFTGERALRFKLAFIGAFNQMEQMIARDLQAQIGALRDSIGNAAIMDYSYKQASDLLQRIHWGYTRLMLAGVKTSGDKNIVPPDIDEQLECLQHLQTLFEEKYIAKQEKLLV
jgi:Rha family phage regulatory protein